MIRTVIVDDEAPARHRLRTLIGSDPNFEIVAECADGVQARSKILELKPDLVLLDIEMPELNGLSLLSGIADRPYTVYITAHAQHALDAFALHADDYLLKPYKDERLLEAIAYAASQIRAKGPTPPSREPSADLQSSPAITRGLLSIRVDGRQLLLRMHEIEWIEAERDYVRISVQKTTYLIRETMQGIQARLDPQRFVRIHRSTIVNVHAIREMEPCPTGECFVTLRDGRMFRMSRSHRQVLGPLLGIG